MKNYKEEIERIEGLIKKYSQRRNKIENSNYILAMELKEIREGRLNSVEDIAKWCFEMIKTGELVRSVERGEGGGRFKINIDK